MNKIQFILLFFCLFLHVSLAFDISNCFYSPDLFKIKRIKSNVITMTKNIYEIFKLFNDEEMEIFKDIYNCLAPSDHFQENSNLLHSE